MPLDHYVTLGRSGLRVSPFALGAMTFGQDPGGAGCSVEESEKILATYLDRGGNFIDTANFYTNGHSEKILGDFFAAHPGRREHVVLASKFFTNLYPGDPNGGGAGRTSIIGQLDETLRRLRTDHLDLYWLHNWDRNTPIEETMRTLDDLVRAGKIRYLGFSNTPAWLTAQARRPHCSRTGPHWSPYRWNFHCWHARSSRGRWWSGCAPVALTSISSNEVPPRTCRVPRCTASSRRRSPTPCATRRVRASWSES